SLLSKCFDLVEGAEPGAQPPLRTGLGVLGLSPDPSVGVLGVPNAPDHSPFRGDHLDLLSELSHFFFLSVPTMSFTLSLPCDQWSMSRPNSSLAPKNSKNTSFSSLSQVECSSEEHPRPCWNRTSRTEVRRTNGEAPFCPLACMVGQRSRRVAYGLAT